MDLENILETQFGRGENEGTEQRDDSSLLQYDDYLTEQKVLEKVKKYNSDWDANKSDYENKLKRHWNLYRNQEFTDGGVSIKMPEIFTIVETELPHLLLSIYGQSWLVDATPKFQDPDGTKTYKVKSYVNKLMKDICDGQKKTEAIIKNSLIYGWSVVKQFWNIDPDMDFDIQTGEFVEKNSSHPDFELVDPFKFKYDLSVQSDNLKDCEWVGERIYISKDKLKMMRDNGEVAMFDDSDLGTEEDSGKKGRNTNKENKSTLTYYDEFSATMYSKTEEGKMVADEYKIWLLANSKVIKFQKNIYKRKMYTIFRAYQNPFELLGVGEPEAVGALSTQLSLAHYQLGKMSKKVGQSLTVLDPSAGISPENLRRIEDGVIFVQNRDGISFEKNNDAQNLKVLLETEEYLEGKIENITGVGKTLQGEGIGDVTATQSSYQYQNAANRLALKLGHIQHDFIKNVAANFFLMLKQLLTDPVEFFDTNNNLIELTPDDLIGSYDWIPTGSISQSNKALQLNQNQQLLGGVIQLSQASQQTQNPFTVNIPYFIQQHLAPYANLPDVKNFIIPAQPMGAQGQVPSVPDGNPPAGSTMGALPQIQQQNPNPQMVGNIEAQVNNSNPMGGA